jgi:glycosyltransferase involved in cell wall biosynthesis
VTGPEASALPSHAVSTISSDVAALVVAFNAERFLGQALASVFAQTVVPDQVVVVDDGSTDGTAAVAAADPRVEVIELDHGGASRARNVGLDRCDRGFVALLDADDVWLPTKIERQLAVLRDGAADAAFCRMDEFVEPDVDVGGVRDPRRSVDAVIPSAVLFRRDIVEQVGPFTVVDISIGDWIDWWSRARGLGLQETIVPEVLLRRRLHDANSSNVRSGDLPSNLLLSVRAHLRAKQSGQ